MRYLLAPSNLPILTRLARHKTICGFDFDGTLAAISSRPDSVQLSQRTRGLLSRLADSYPCAVLSGRARSDVLARLDGIKLSRVFGNHGAEDGSSVDGRRQVREWASLLSPALGGIDGVRIEEKGWSLAIHFRNCSRRASVRKTILAEVANLEGAIASVGKFVVNVFPVHSPDKGIALAAERDRLQCDWVLYIGDDDNDEHAFALSGNIVSVRVGKTQNSRAAYYLRRRSEVDEVIALLSRLRNRTRRRSGRES